LYHWKNKRVLVTGGAGFIGGELVEDLLKLGVIVDVIDNCSVGTEKTLPEGVDLFIKGDVNRENLKDLTPKYDIVFHFGAPCSILLFDRDPLKLYENAITAAYSIREFCHERRIPYLVYASSATVYGKQTGSKLCDSWKCQEDLPFRPVNIYGLTKCSEECMDSLFPNLRTLGLRIFPSYGAREFLKGSVASVPYQFLVQMMKGNRPEIWEPGQQTRDFIYIDDLIYCISALVERKVKGIINIGTGRTVDYPTLVLLINEILGTDLKVKLFPNPYPKNYVVDLKCDNSLLLEYIGHYKFVDIATGLTLMLEEVENETRAYS